MLKCVFTSESFVSIIQDPEVADMMGDMVADMVEQVYWVASTQYTCSTRPSSHPPPRTGPHHWPRAS